MEQKNYVRKRNLEKGKETNERKREKVFKNETGITLIALMITVIVLLILAGVTLSLTLGERGIFKTATDAKIKTERAEIIEQAKLEIVDKQTENMGEFTESELVEILNKYGTLSDNGEETILDKTLTTTNKLHEIKVSEIWDIPFKKIEQNNKISFTIDEEPFQVDEGTTWESFLREQNKQNPNYADNFWMYDSMNGGYVLLFQEVSSDGVYAICSTLIRSEDYNDDLGNYEGYNQNVLIKKDDIISPGEYMVDGYYEAWPGNSGSFD